MNPGLTILACLLGFFFSFLCVQIGAVTDQTPLTAASKASQLVFGGATAGHVYSIMHAQKLNLIAGGIASNQLTSQPPLQEISELASSSAHHPSSNGLLKPLAPSSPSGWLLECSCSSLQLTPVSSIRTNTTIAPS